MPENHAAQTRSARLLRTEALNAFARSEKLGECVIKVGYKVTTVSEVIKVFHE